MSANPWTDSDPQPGDFDVELAKLDPQHVEHHEGDPDAKLSDREEGRIASQRLADLDAGRVASVSADEVAKALEQ